MRDRFGAGVVVLAIAALGGCSHTPGAPARTDASAGVVDASPDASPDGGVAISPSCTGKGGMAGDSDVMITVPSGKRSYLLHIPPQYDPTMPMPLLVAMHGLTNSPAEMRDLTHFNLIGDQRGFVVAYPAGVTEAWNGGACCGLPMIENLDDVGFISAVLDQLEAELCIDHKRVYAAGFSNGGFMAHRVGCELSDRFAAIGVTAGEEAIASCAPVRAVPVVQVHGTADPLVPYGGDPLLGFPSTMTTMSGWAARDGCAATTTVLGVTGSVTCISWNGCPTGTDVVLCTNQGGVHDWVNGGSLWVDGVPPPGFDNSDYFADFFAAHPMP